MYLALQSKTFVVKRSANYLELLEFNYFENWGNFIATWVTLPQSTAALRYYKVVQELFHSRAGNNLLRSGTVATAKSSSYYKVGSRAVHNVEDGEGSI